MSVASWRRATEALPSRSLFSDSEALLKMVCGETIDGEQPSPRSDLCIEREATTCPVDLQLEPHGPVIRELVQVRSHAPRADARRRLARQRVGHRTHTPGAAAQPLRIRRVRGQGPAHAALLQARRLAARADRHDGAVRAGRPAFILHGGHGGGLAVAEPRPQGLRQAPRRVQRA
eukprot:1028751-Prymnesium_polylepis.2